MKSPQSVTEGDRFQGEVPERTEKSVEKQRRPRNGFANTTGKIRRPGRAFVQFTSDIVPSELISDFVPYPQSFSYPNQWVMDRRGALMAAGGIFMNKNESVTSLVPELRLNGITSLAPALNCRDVA